MNNMDINFLLSKYSDDIDRICNKYKYDVNIKHLIKLILVLFITKYGIKNEKAIISCFENTKIIVNKAKRTFEEAYFYRKLIYIDTYEIYKYIVINEFKKETYIDLIDTIIHEFNHVANSINNEIMIDEKYIYLRTGISYIKYDKNDINNVIGKTQEFVLEEIINTKQTEEIINLINNIDINNIRSIEFKNFISVIKNEIKEKTYSSKAYFLESKIMQDLLNNKTFISTLENLRFLGKINDIEDWFDSIVGKKGEYKRLNINLNEIINLEDEYLKKIFSRFIIKYKLKNRVNTVKQIVNEFNNSCNYR